MTAAPAIAASDGSAPALINHSTAQHVYESESLGSAVPLTPEDQFIEAVLKWLQTRLDEADAITLKGIEPCVFVFAEGQAPASVLQGLVPAPSFKSSTDADIGGHVHVSALQMRSVNRKHVGFKDVPDTVAWSHANGLAKYTLVVASPRAREAIVLRKNVDPDDCDKVSLAPKSTAPFDFTQVPALLEEFHKTWTKSHLGYCRIWAEATKRTLKPLPEGQIQGSLIGFFEYTVRPRSVLVDEEFATFNGRGDVRLVKWSRSKGGPESGLIEVCILELKVLSRTKSDAKNEEWAMSGIQQLLNYRAAKPAPGPSFLCCYDGRKADEPMPTVEAHAKKVGVVPKRFFLETPGCRASA